MTQRNLPDRSGGMSSTNLVSILIASPTRSSQSLLERQTMDVGKRRRWHDPDLEVIRGVLYNLRLPDLVEGLEGVREHRGRDEPAVWGYNDVLGLGRDVR